MKMKRQEIKNRILKKMTTNKNLDEEILNYNIKILEQYHKQTMHKYLLAHKVNVEEYKCYINNKERNIENMIVITLDILNNNYYILLCNYNYDNNSIHYDNMYMRETKDSIYFTKVNNKYLENYILDTLENNIIKGNI